MIRPNNTGKNIPVLKSMLFIDESFIHFLLLFVGRSLVQYKLKYNKIFSWADCKKNLKRIHQFCFADDTTVFVYDLSSHYYFAPHCLAGICQLCERLSSLSLSLIPLCWLPPSLADGPIHTGPDHELCWVIHWSNQTGMTIQNVNKCNSCSRPTHYSHLTRAAENGEKYTTWLFECFPSVFASESKLDLLRGEIHCPILTLQVILHSVNIVHFRVCFYLRAMTGLVAWHLIFGRKYSHCIAALCLHNLRKHQSIPVNHEIQILASCGSHKELKPWDVHFWKHF